MQIHKDAAPKKQALSKSVEGWSHINTHEQAEAWRPDRWLSVMCHVEKAPGKHSQGGWEVPENNRTGGHLDGGS